MPAVRPRFAVPHYDSWQDAFKDAVRDPAELCRLLDLPTAFVDAARAADRTFPLFVPRGFVGRMRPGDPAIRCCDRFCQFTTNWNRWTGSSQTR